MNRRTMMVAALALILPACEADTTEPDEVTIAGTYTFQTIDGHAFPYTVDGEVKTGGTLELKSDKTFTVAVTWHHVSGPNVTDNDHGTYTLADKTIVLRSSVDNESVTGTFSGTTLTITADDGIYVLKKN